MVLEILEKNSRFWFFFPEILILLKILKIMSYNFQSRKQILTLRGVYCLGIVIFCQKGISSRGQSLARKNFHPEEIFCFRDRGHFPGLTLVFGNFGPIASISTLNFGSWSTNFGGTVISTRKMTRIDNVPNPGAVSIREKGTFFLAQNCPVVARTWCPSRSAFLGPIIRISAQKYVLCYRSLEFVNGPFEALGETVDFAG